jgi:hypothetical protein
MARDDHQATGIAAEAGVVSEAAGRIASGMPARARNRIRKLQSELALAGEREAKRRRQVEKATAAGRPKRERRRRKQLDKAVRRRARSGRATPSTRERHVNRRGCRSENEASPTGSVALGSGPSRGGRVGNIGNVDRLEGPDAPNAPPDVDDPDSPPHRG